jgi:tRNA 2-thiocytidine biosynthesis protein TtcA
LKEKRLSKIVGLAVNDYDMIKDGERVLAGVSGGMDSIALVTLLHSRLQRIPVSYEIIPVLIDHYNGEDKAHNDSIKSLAEFLLNRTGLTLQIIRLPLLSYLSGNDKETILPRNICFKCSQIRRSELIKIALSYGCARLAFGHHKDDIVETALMNMFYRRELSSMIPRLPLFEGKIDIIRPLAYLEKSRIMRYINDIKAPVIEEGCPAKVLKRDLDRDKIRNTIRTLSKDFPSLRDNIFASFRNPHPGYLLNHLYNPKTKGMKKRP